MTAPEKPVTSTKIPGTNIPDVTQAQAESDRQRRWMSRVAVGTAVLATFASLSSMYGNNHLNQAMIEQIRAADQWAFFQAKGIKLAVLEGRIELMPALGKEVAEPDTARAARYKSEQEQISTEAKARQASCDDHRARQAVFARASTAFQVGIALSAVALLVRKNWIFLGAVLVGLVGCAFFTQGLWPA